MRKKKLTEEEIKAFIADLVKKVKIETSNEYSMAYLLMEIAEDTLRTSLDPNQTVLYEDFCKKRDAFYDIADIKFLKKS